MITMPNFSDTISSLSTVSSQFTDSASKLYDQIIESCSQFEWPKLSHAAMYVGIFTLCNVILTIAIRILTSTSQYKEVEIGPYTTTVKGLHSQHPKLYKIATLMSPSIAAIATLAILKSHDMSMPWQLAAGSALVVTLYHVINNFE